jgi:hypothetical protein
MGEEFAAADWVFPRRIQNSGGQVFILDDSALRDTNTCTFISIDMTTPT